MLAPGGVFLIWDVVFPQRLDADKDVAVFPLLVKLPPEEIDAGYGVLWPEEGRDSSYYVNLAEQAGFVVVERREESHQFFLKLQKP